VIQADPVLVADRPRVPQDDLAGGPRRSPLAGQAVQQQAAACAHAE
jgi:hypothetical protein